MMLDVVGGVGTGGIGSVPVTGSGVDGEVVVVCAFAQTVHATARARARLRKSFTDISFTALYALARRLGSYEDLSEQLGVIAAHMQRSRENT